MRLYLAAVVKLREVDTAGFVEAADFVLVQRRAHRVCQHGMVGVVAQIKACAGEEQGEGNTGTIIAKDERRGYARSIFTRLNQLPGGERLQLFGKVFHSGSEYCSRGTGLTPPGMVMLLSCRKALIIPPALVSVKVSGSA